MRKLLVTAGLVTSIGIGSFPLRGALAADPPPPNGSFSGPASASTPVPSYNRAAVSGSAIVQYALKFLGYPYTATGNSPSTGFSCIGFVSYVYRSKGINLPGDLGGALAFAPRVAFANLQPGDILYFQNTVWAGLSHAAIYLGGGRFVHAEWYNRGVVTSSFTNDPVDGNYWTSHYLGANRPWTGSSVTAVTTAPTVQPTPLTRATPSIRPTFGSKLTPSPVSTPVTVPTPSAAPARASTQLPAGPSALVRVSSLNVRSGPSIRAAIYAVVRRGTQLIILGRQHGWYKVALPNGTIGWVIGFGIGKGDIPRQRDRVILTTPTSTATARPTPVRTATVRRVSIPKRLPTRQTVTVHVHGLRVHTAPALNAAVLGVAALSRPLTVLGSTNQWVKVRLPNKTVGWVSRQYAHLQSGRTVSRSAAVSVRHTPFSRQAKVALNVRARSSLASAIVGVVVPGGAYRILRWSGGWARVRLSQGTTGWISGSVLGAGFTTSSSARTTRSSVTAHRSAVRRATVTAGVRLHVGPSLNSAAIRLLASGTHLQVLNTTAGWSEVRLSSHQSGYVLGVYIKQ